VIVGIDPGLSGALFFIDPRQPSVAQALDLPVHVLTRGRKAKREVDVQGLVDLLSAELAHAFVARVGAMPGQGVSSVLAFRKCYGIIIGVLAAHGVPMTLVPPGTWKKALGVPKAKDGARARASQLLLRAADQWLLVKHDGRGEAALIALWGLRQLNGAAPSIKRTKTADLFALPGGPQQPEAGDG
jgi:crossover junction endodeoxyribonuclease RuvC